KAQATWPQSAALTFALRALRQQRLDQPQQLHERASVAVHRGAPLLSDARASIRVGKQRRHSVGELLPAVHDFGRAARNQQPRDILTVEVMWAGQYRHSQRRWLEQVVPANRQQTAANERNIVRAVALEQLSQRIEH